MVIAYCLGCGVKVNYVYVSPIISELPPMCKECCTLYTHLNLVEWDNFVERVKQYRPNHKMSRM